MTITELSAAQKLEAFRREQEHFLGNSFDPIISYGEHAAMNHYSATPKTDVPIRPEGFVLADTGGHYLEGSTDITRTIAMGALTQEQKTYFTAVLRGHLNLGAAKFRYGCRGINLDYLARSPLWELDADFNHGTGHGVGYLLSVHEGPNGIRWKLLQDKDENGVLEPGMITSNEPGYVAHNVCRSTSTRVLANQSSTSTDHDTSLARASSSSTTGFAVLWSHLRTTP